MTAAEYALSLIRPGDRVGLGTGKAATVFVKALGVKVQEGLSIVGVPTSDSTADLARLLGIRLSTLEETPELDITVDGADEVDPQLSLIKGYGGALLREKIVAASSRRLLILVGPEKIVPFLGCRKRLPVEVVPFAASFCQGKLKGLGLPSVVRQHEGKTFITDNGNLILDVQVERIANPAGFETTLLAIPGVVGTGLFVGMAEQVAIDEPGGARVMSRVN